MNPTFIAEIKTQSPFGYKSPHAFVDLMRYAIVYGDWISVHTNALWGGDFEAISFVRNNTDKPILAKGFHTTDDDVKRALDHGATWVLRVNAFPKHYAEVAYTIWECNDMNDVYDMQGFLAKPYNEELKFCVNSRDIRTGLPKKYDEWQKYADTDHWICQASNIKTMDDVRPGASAFIVGENLVEFCKSLPKE